MTFDSLIMLPFVVEEDCWGLFEVYREGTTAFTTEDVARATAITDCASAVVEAHQRRSAA